MKSKLKEHPNGNHNQANNMCMHICHIQHIIYNIFIVVDFLYISIWAYGIAIYDTVCIIRDTIDKCEKNPLEASLGLDRWWLMMMMMMMMIMTNRCRKILPFCSKCVCFYVSSCIIHYHPVFCFRREPDFFQQSHSFPHPFLRQTPSTLASAAGRSVAMAVSTGPKWVQVMTKCPMALTEIACPQTHREKQRRIFLLIWEQNHWVWLVVVKGKNFEPTKKKCCNLQLKKLLCLFPIPLFPQNRFGLTWASGGPNADDGYVVYSAWLGSDPDICSRSTRFRSETFVAAYWWKCILTNPHLWSDTQKNITILLPEGTKQWYVIKHYFKYISIVFHHVPTMTFGPEFGSPKWLLLLVLQPELLVSRLASELGELGFSLHHGCLERHEMRWFLTYFE